MGIKIARIRDEMADREAIRDCMSRYCRGIDRADPELLASAYWPGAMDYHSGFTGSVEEFVDWAMPRLAAMEHSVHMTGQSLIRLEGDRAKVETYFWSVSILAEVERRQVITTGRYLDRFERRDDEWRIAERLVAHDWYEEGPATGDWAVGPFGMKNLLLGAVSREDKSYDWLGLT